MYVYFSLNVFQKKSFFQVRCHSRNLKPLKISSLRVIPKSWQRLSSFLNFLLFFFNYFISSEVAAEGLFWKKLIWQIFKQENTCTGVLRPATLLKIDSNIDAFLRINFHNSCFSRTPPNDCFCELYKTNHKYLNYKLPINYILHCTTNHNWKKHLPQFFSQTIVWSLRNVVINCNTPLLHNLVSFLEHFFHLRKWCKKRELLRLSYKHETCHKSRQTCVVLRN